LVERHKLDPRPLDEDPKPIEAKLRWHLHGTILEGNSILVRTKKWSSKESSWFGELRCKLGSKVVSSVVFHYFKFFSLFFKVIFSFVLEVEIVQEWKTFHGWRRTFLSAHPPFHF
jgi:hypothetical protein